MDEILLTGEKIMNSSKCKKLLKPGVLCVFYSKLSPQLVNLAAEKKKKKMNEEATNAISLRNHR